MSLRKLLFGCIGILGTALQAGAASAPYTENFDDDTLGSSAPAEASPESGTFITSASTAWSVVAGTGASDYDFQNSFNATGTAVASNAALDFAGSLGGALNRDFTISTDFKLDTFSVTSANITVGLGALGLNSGFSGGAANVYYLADVNLVDLGTPSNVGMLRILEVGATNTTIASQVSGVAINSTDTFRLTLQGTYVGSSLALSFTFQNVTTPTPATGNGSATITGTDTTPLSGTYIGYRNRINGSGTLDVNFDNFSVVPEPATGVLLLSGMIGLLARRRRA